jgi:glycopeptide antibiotics resistance protein
MDLLIPLLLFLLGAGVSWFFTRSLILGVIGGVIILMLYYGVISISFHPTKLIPSSIRGVVGK